MNWHQYNHLTRAIIVVQNLLLKYKKNPDKIKELSSIAHYWQEERDRLLEPYERLSDKEYSTLTIY